MISNDESRWQMQSHREGAQIVNGSCKSSVTEPRNPNCTASHLWASHLQSKADVISGRREIFSTAVSSIKPCSVMNFGDGGACVKKSRVNWQLRCQDWQRACRSAMPPQSDFVLSGARFWKCEANKLVRFSDISSCVRVMSIRALQVTSGSGEPFAPSSPAATAMTQLMKSGGRRKRRNYYNLTWACRFGIVQLAPLQQQSCFCLTDMTSFFNGQTGGW